MRTDGQAHGHHAGNSCFSQFCKPAYKHYTPVCENITKNTYFIEMGQLIPELTKRLSLKLNMPVQSFLYPTKSSFMLFLSTPLKSFCVVFSTYRTVT
jgi:hypothetical protein